MIATRVLLLSLSAMGSAYPAMGGLTLAVLTIG